MNNNQLINNKTPLHHQQAESVCAIIYFSHWCRNNFELNKQTRPSENDDQGQ